MAFRDNAFESDARIHLETPCSFSASKATNQVEGGHAEAPPFSEYEADSASMDFRLGQAYEILGGQRCTEAHSQRLKVRKAEDLLCVEALAANKING